MKDYYEGPEDVLQPESLPRNIKLVDKKPLEDQIKSSFGSGGAWKARAVNAALTEDGASSGLENISVADLELQIRPAAPAPPAPPPPASLVESEVLFVVNVSVVSHDSMLSPPPTPLTCC